MLRTVFIIVQFRNLKAGKFGRCDGVRVQAQIRRSGAGSVPDWGRQSGTGLMKTNSCGPRKNEAEDISGVFTRALL